MMKEIEDLTLDALAPGEEQVRNCFSVASESLRVGLKGVPFSRRGRRSRSR